MNARIVLPAQTYVKVQRSFMLGWANRTLFTIIERNPLPNEEDLAKFWIAWPDVQHSSAAIFGSFVRME